MKGKKTNKKAGKSGAKQKEASRTVMPLECDICQRTFSDFAELSTHISSHLDDTLHECSQCDEVFLRVDDLYQHSLHVHGVTVKSEPDTGSQNDEVIAQNIPDVIYNVPIKEEPDFSFVYNDQDHFSNLQSLGSGLITPDGNCDPSVNCDVQIKQEPILTPEFHCTSSYNEPAIPPPRVSEQVYVCNICAATYTRRDLLKHTQEHMFTPEQLKNKGKKRKMDQVVEVPDVKAVLKQFECNICSERFERMKDLVNHAPAHSDIAEQLSTDNLYCSHCDQDFVRKKDFVIHMKIHKAPPEDESSVRNLVHQLLNGNVEDNEFGMRCNNCGVRFEYMVQLTEHMKWCKVFECDICSLKFYTANNLTEHLSSHLEDTLHECHHCQEVYLDKQDLIQHMKIHLTSL